MKWWRIRNRRKPHWMPSWRWVCGNLWRKLLYACGLHWKQRRTTLTWYRLTRLIRARMMERAERWDRILRAEPCVYCGMLYELEKMTVEHVIPKSRGGPDVSLNKVGCCGPCNRKRGSMPLLHYLLMRQGVDVRAVRAERDYRMAQQARVRTERGLLLPHGPTLKLKPLTTTMGEMTIWKRDQQNRKPTDIDLRRHAAG